MSDVWREWVEKAEEDFRLADAALNLVPGDNSNSACFHAQQCIEKLLKAILVRSGDEVPRTHDLWRLSRLVSAVSPDWVADEQIMVELTRAAVVFRYPGEYATVEQAKELLEQARIVRQQLRATLGVDLT